MRGVDERQIIAPDQAVQLDRRVRQLFRGPFSTGARIKPSDEPICSIYAIMIDWSHVDCVFLDMDGTLLDLRFDNYFWREFIPERYATDQGLDQTKAREALLGLMRSLQGTLNWYCTEFWSRELGLDVLALKTECRDLIQVRPGAKALLQALDASPLRVVLVTNAPPETIDLKMAETGIRPHFNQIISSHQFGCPKEDPDFWPRLAAIEPFVPKRTLFIDDNLSVLRAAQAYGIGHLFAVPNPDSGRPPTSTEEFAGLSTFEDLTQRLHRTWNRSPSGSGGK